MTKKEYFLKILKNRKKDYVGWIRRIEDNEGSVEYMTQFLSADDPRIEHLIEVVEYAYDDNLLAVKMYNQNQILVFGRFDSINQFHKTICEYVEKCV